ncbi:3,4-dihydroxy 2-butanone 4-phosphate synthase/GTP cyclohydrolase II [Sphingomonas jejuensis]|uniref:3,4-dihydroxy-2-butanone 4-phosphate synthase n=1 Tax=Sphingomonas jejuensis TaxID=904715 RepID=A0ABX0XPY3_9SPHN|nr:3,4-dihydroxy-2-butanone-4-phosphate synthase [Sphingomonas jejuensis]NJC34912.1 3,4-dihydroxy 2-butanone 4-phosphate synthase/GTP cyclohydrolase II [Sphingomonas jejuensis]
MSSILIDRLRDIVEAGEITRSGLARAAGLHPNSLRRLGESDWNPTADTLQKLERFLQQGTGGVMASAERIIDEARNGRMFILVDDDDRENEGDLVIPAQMATPDAINFMARHGRGLICLALSKPRVEQLGLPLMTKANGTRHETAFTVSIEAREGVTTGISAADRARTIAVAIDAANGPETIVSPGHVFPLVAREGGVLVRTGHTEAAVDVARLAGLNPSGVICEIMNEDGTMARMDDLVSFARLHGLRIGTIRDLIAYRRRHDHLLERRAEARFTSRWGGDWTAITFFNKATATEQIALVKGRIDSSRPTIVRMHAMSPFADLFGEDSPRHGLLGRAMAMIAEAGTGVLVLLAGSGPGALAQAVAARGGGPRPSDAEVLRDYGVGAQILAELGVQDMILLTNSHHTPVALAGYGLDIVEERPIVGGE